MIRKPEGYDESWAATGEAKSLPAGCYVCVIKKANVVNEYGKEKLVILYDIAEGEQAGFFQAQYNAAKSNANSDVKWRGEHKQVIGGSSLPFFKGLITSVEKSNPGFIFEFGVENNEKSLVNKKFGAVMGREQFKASDGELRWATKIVQVRSIEGLKDAKVPEDKPYAPDDKNQGGPIPYIGGTPQRDTGFMNIPDGFSDELPF